MTFKQPLTPVTQWIQTLHPNRYEHWDLKSVSKQFPFIEWCAQTYFSFCHATSAPETLILEAAQLGYVGLNIADWNAWNGALKGYGWWRQWGSSTQAPLKLYAGVEIQHESHAYVIIPRDLEGYRQLCQAISHHWGFNASFHQWAVGKDFWPSQPPNWVILALPPWNESLLEQWAGGSGYDFYLAVTHNLTREGFQELEWARLWARRRAIPRVLTQRVKWARNEAHLWPLLQAIYHQKPLKTITPPRNPQNRLHHPMTLYRLYRFDLELLHNSLEIAEKIQFQWEQLKFQYPKASLAPGFKDSWQWLAHMTRELLRTHPHLRNKHQWKKVLERELALIAQMGWADYLLTLHEMTSWAQKEGLLFQGRGSSGHSLVCYLLGLSHVNPENIPLVLERFMNPERPDPPDVDLDFEHEKRPQVIQYLEQRWGWNRVAQVNLIQTFQEDQSLRQTAKALEIPESWVTWVQRYFRDYDLKKASEGRWRKEFIQQIRKQQPLWDENLLDQWLYLSAQLVGIPYHSGLHPSGFVLSAEPLSQWTIWMKTAKPHRWKIQWDKEDLEILKILKVDILGLGILSVIRRFFEEKRQPLRLPQTFPDHPKAFELIHKGLTIGLFQVESPAQIQVGQRWKPRTLYDLAIQVAIVRPGPIRGGLQKPLLEAKEKGQPFIHPKPEIQNLFERTYGICVFQEQLMMWLQKVAGISLTQADQIRRLLGHNRKSESWALLGPELKARMIQQGFSPTYADHVMKTLKGFSAYGFPETHAMAFAQLAALTAQAKAEDPALYGACWINSQPTGFYRPDWLLAELQQNFGVNVYGLHLLKSQWYWQVRSPEQAIQEGWITLKRGRQIYQKLARIQAQYRNTQWDQDAVKATPQEIYHWLKDLQKRAGLEPHEGLWLIKSGALDFLQISRMDLLAISAQVWKERFLLEMTQPDHPFWATDQWPPGLRSREKWLIWWQQWQCRGYHPTQHPMKFWQQIWEIQGNFHPWQITDPKFLINFEKAQKLRQSQHEREWTGLAIVEYIQRPPTANGHGFALIWDESGWVQVHFHPDLMSQSRFELRPHTLGYWHLIRSNSLELPQPVWDVQHWIPLARLPT